MSIAPSPPSTGRSAPRRGALALTIALTTALIGAAALSGCARRGYDPELATDPYPLARHQPTSVDIQMFRDGTRATIMNATTQSYRSPRLWLNQRYVREIPDLEAGRQIEISLRDFRDERGETFIAGGFFRTERTTSLRIAELEVPDAETLVGIEVMYAGADG